MASGLRLVLAIHNHQPIGNFDWVFRDAYRDSYAPFLDLLAEYPEIPISLHLSGSLLEWLVDAEPEYIDHIRALTERGQIEILGGAFYEPILAGIPQRDRIGQITSYTRYLEQLFGATVRGMWIPERVWEQSFASDIADAGIEYTLLDDFHFQNAGLRDDDLHGYYLTEDEGQLLKVFPGSERLRYTIPFADPHETIDYLRGIAERHPGSVVTFGDDGEKFGTWPETHEHVYTNGWLRRFFDALRDNRDWLTVSTLAEAVDHVPPAATCYLPDASYREMTEWALPTDRQIEYRHLVHRREHDPDWNELKQFLRGGFWRNFRVKYPEANEMYARMLEVSNRLHALQNDAAAQQHPEQIAAARSDLYRAQCNCSYWHGAFGGLYLPHLRNAVYRHLIAADTALDHAAGRTSDSPVQATTGDFNLDARQEVRLASDRLVGYLAPARGGILYEFDVRGTKHNLLATLNRRPEAYHEQVRQVAARQQNPNDDHPASIHDMVRFKQPHLDQKLIYDHWPRKSLVDHFLQPGLTLEEFQRGGGELGDFVQGVFETRVRHSPGQVAVVMTRRGEVGPYAVRMTKTVTLAGDRGGSLRVTYELDGLPPNVPIHFGVEFQFAGLAAGQPDRYFYDARGTQLGPLETVQTLSAADRIGLIDEWLGLDAAVDVSRPADIWTFPIQTVSLSEGGFELVHQSTCVIPHWEFVTSDDGSWSVEVTLGIDTSVAQARKLREAAVTG